MLSKTEKGMAFMTTESETTVFCARASLAITKPAWGGIRQKKQAAKLLIANEKYLGLLLASVYLGPPLHFLLNFIIQDTRAMFDMIDNKLKLRSVTKMFSQGFVTPPFSVGRVHAT